jgi:hypothetical protein
MKPIQEMRSRFNLYCRALPNAQERRKQRALGANGKLVRYSGQSWLRRWSCDMGKPVPEAVFATRPFTPGKLHETELNAPAH